MGMQNRFVAVYVICLTVFSSALARGQEPLEKAFAGKQIEIVVGTSAGGGYDVYARLIARYLGNYLPGKPGVVVRNMPGAGGIRAVQYIFSIAPRDGTSIGAILPSALLQPLLGDKSKAQFDPTRFVYLGTPSEEAFVCLVRSDAPVTKFEEAFHKQLVIGGTAPGASANNFAAALSNVLGAKFKIVSGYAGSTEILLAIERGELQGFCGMSWLGLVARRAELLESGKVRLLVQVTLNKGNPVLDKMGVPLAIGFAKTREQREILELIFSELAFGRPYILPPGVATERVAALRSAFTATLNDQAFVAEAEKLNLEVKPVSGENLQALVQKVYALPAAIVERSKESLVHK
jgi:tripartite-type tricarboxylate transporter receptor subunit TctC